MNQYLVPLVLSLMLFPFWTFISGERGYAQNAPLFFEGIEAVVNGSVILSGEVEERVRLVAAEAGLETPAGETYQRLRQQVLEEMIHDELILQAGKAAGAELSQVALESRVNDEMQQMENSPYYKRMGGLDTVLQRMGRTREGLRKSLMRRIARDYTISQALYRNVDSKSEVSIDDVQTFRQENPQEYERQQKVLVRQLALRVPQDATPGQVDALEQRINDFYLRIRAGADDFVSLIETHSEHEPSQRNKGLLPQYSKGELHEGFDVAFHLQPGETARPFRTGFGFHLVRLEDRQTIEDYLRMTRKRKILDDWLRELGENAQIIIKGEES